MAQRKKKVGAGHLALPEQSRARPTVDKDVAERFEDRARGAPARSPGTKRRAAELGVRVVGRVPKELERRLRLRCITDECSISYAMNEAVTLWLDKRDGEDPL